MVSSLWEENCAPGLGESISQNRSFLSKSFERSKTVYIGGNKLSFVHIIGLNTGEFPISVIDHDRKNAATHNDYILKEALLVFTY